jgi:hypothetical protein
VTEPHHDGHADATARPEDVETVASADVETDQPDEAAAVADPRVEDAVRRLNELADLPPADHVEVYEAVHSSLQESLAAASRQADESPADGSTPS